MYSVATDVCQSALQVRRIHFKPLHGVCFGKQGRPGMMR